MKETPLHRWHVKHGALMREFGGYEMPLWYPAGAKREHLSVLTGAGIFDTSHMSVLSVYGRDAFDLLQWCFTKDLIGIVNTKKIDPANHRKCSYGMFLDEAGRVIDDSIVYSINHYEYLVVVNASMGEKIKSHLETQGASLEVNIIDMSDRVGKIDLQGYQSARILAKILIDPEKVFYKLGYFTFRGHFDPSSPHSQEVLTVDRIPLLISRTGYTGEFGFELFVMPEYLERLWNRIIDAGESFGLLPCGLAARDSLRAGAVLPLSPHDIGDWLFARNPWIFALPFTQDKTGFTKDFMGRKAVEDPSGAYYTYPFAGYDLRKVTSHESPAEVVDDSGLVIGKVLSCVTDMGIGRFHDRIYSIASPDKPEEFIPQGLSCGFIMVSKPLSYGDKVIMRDSKRQITVSIVKTVRPDLTARRPIAEIFSIEQPEEIELETIT
jgi:aminomethyltransferase